jgi:hypothetical protein
MMLPVLTVLRHRRVLLLLDSFQAVPDHIIVLECGGCDLHRLIPSGPLFRGLVRTSMRGLLECAQMQG